MRLRHRRMGCGRALECRGRNVLVLAGRRVVGQLRGLGHISAVLEPNLEDQPILAGPNDDVAAVEQQLVLVLQAAAGGERLAIELHAGIATDGLHERHAVEEVEQHDRAAAGAGQAQRAIAAGPDAQRQLVGTDAPLSLDVPDKQMVETQIASSQRTTMGRMSISGPTWNSSRTSR